MGTEKSTLAIEIGRRIAERRKQLGLTQAQAAEKAGLTQQFFASVETGAKNIRAESIIKVSRALNIADRNCYGFGPSSGNENAGAFG